MHHPPLLKKGAKVAGYAVLGELGRGAASNIYLVQDPRTKQIWAFKHVVKNSPKDQRFLEQTETEYEIGSKIKDPRIRRCVRLIKSRKMMAVREMYLLMEYVDGVSVERARPTDILRALSVFKEVAAGLAVMHEQGYVHADIKPNNIVVLDDGSVKIIDLGQSCKIGTVKPRIQGTPDYIAPEQVHRQPITPQTDVYNLGATMYWTLTGNHIPTALPKDDRLVGSLDAGFIEMPPPPHEVSSAVPERLSNLVMRCIQPEVEDRPVDMRAVAESLESILAHVKAQERLKRGEFDEEDDDDDESSASAQPAGGAQPDPANPDGRAEQA